MAIEKMTFNSLQDVADAIDSLGWFDSVTVSSGAVICKIGEIKYLEIFAVLAGNSSQTVPYIKFWTKGASQSGTQLLEAAYSYFKQKYAVKTRNGIIFASHRTGAEQEYCTWMLAKTTNGKLAVVVPYWNNYNASYKTGAIDETSTYIDSSRIFLNLPAYEPDGAWADTSQMIVTPIPTHPQSGTSIIKNGFGFTLCPRLTLGKWIINGKEYATNGIFALSDED